MRNRTLIVLLIGLFATLGTAKDTKSNDPFEIFKTAFKHAKDGSAKRNICVKAIDDGVITIGAPIAVVDRLFEGQQRQDYLESGAAFRRIHFEKLIPGSSDAEGYSTAHYPGWYLYVEVNGDGKITAYYLTNIAKMMLMK